LTAFIAVVTIRPHTNIARLLKTFTMSSGYFTNPLSVNGGSYYVGHAADSNEYYTRNPLSMHGSQVSPSAWVQAVQSLDRTLDDDPHSVSPFTSTRHISTNAWVQAVQNQDRELDEEHNYHSVSQFADHPDLVEGLITSPRVAPHRRGLAPSKSCLKKSPRHTQSTAGTTAGRRGASFSTDLRGTVTSRCMITDRPVEARQRSTKEWRYALRSALKRKPRGEKAPKECPDWTSPLDEPMTGISSDLDLAAAQYRAEEEELDARLQFAAFNWQRNKADCPIPTKKHRSLHPAVLESKAQRMSQAQSILSCQTPGSN